MVVILVIAGLVILAAVILVAVGRGGALSVERSDYAPLDLGPVSATDVALLRPPTAAWGYNMQATDEALARIAESIRARDVRIVALEQLVTDLSRDSAPPPLASAYVGTRRRALPEATGAPAGTSADEAAGTAGTAGTGQPGAPASGDEVTWTARDAWAREAARPAETPWPAPATRPEQAVGPRDAAPSGDVPSGDVPPGDVPPGDVSPGDPARPDGERPPGPPEQSHD